MRKVAAMKPACDTGSASLFVYHAHSAPRLYVQSDRGSVESSRANVAQAWRQALAALAADTCRTRTGGRPDTPGRRTVPAAAGHGAGGCNIPPGAGNSRRHRAVRHPACGAAHAGSVARGSIPTCSLDPPGAGRACRRHDAGRYLAGHRPRCHRSEARHHVSLAAGWRDMPALQPAPRIATPAPRPAGYRQRAAVHCGSPARTRYGTRIGPHRRKVHAIQRIETRRPSTPAGVHPICREDPRCPVFSGC
ncbi:hypothetical protein G6F68_010897 [Rhizopus microsporus]|nr:hypothetical protein G6F68_010897 [Rhizopus microsporus]